MLRLASGLLLLPLLLRLLSVPDLGMYYVFLSLGALIPIIDFGFSLSVERNVSYAMGGATELQRIGIQPLNRKSEPNAELLWQLLSATRFLYRTLALAALVLLATFGSYMIGIRVEETSSPFHTWLAWFIAIGAAGLELYAGWWNVFLRGMNQVGLSARLACLAYALKLALSCGFLLWDGGLMSVPIASFCASLVQRMLARRFCLRLLGKPGFKDDPGKIRSIIAILWPNTWRLGLQLVALYLSTNANALICLKVFGLSANAEYGLSVQIMSIIQGIGLVWTWVKFPLIGQLRIENDLSAVRRVLWPRVWLQSGTVFFLAVAAISLGPTLLEWLGTGKRLMPQFWLILLAANAFLETQFTLWTTLISTENRIPALWPTVATHLLSLVLVLALLQCTTLGLGVFVVSPLLAGCLFNYWYWPVQGARSLESGWFHFMFSYPRQLCRRLTGRRPLAYHYSRIVKTENDPAAPPCPVCGETHFDVIDLFPAKDLAKEYRRQHRVEVRQEFPRDLTAFTLLQCQRCGMQFYNPLISGSASFYAQVSESPCYYSTTKWEYRRALDLIPARAEVIDVGCGDGYFLSLLPQEIKLGLDFNPKAVAAATARGLNVKQGGLEKASDHSADAITLFQVLEHVTEPLALLKEALRVLRRGGQLLIAVPNNDGFVGELIQAPLNAPPHHPLRWRAEPLSYLPRVLPLKLASLQVETLAPSDIFMYRKALFTHILSKCLRVRIPLMRLTLATVFVRRLVHLAVKMSLLVNARVPAKPATGFSILAVYEKL